MAEPSSYRPPPAKSPPTRAFTVSAIPTAASSTWGKEPAQPPQQLFCVPTDTEPEDLCDGAYGGECGVDRGGERDGIAAA